MRIAFYYFNLYSSFVDCKDLSKGNPGIGGTEYEILLLAYTLNKRNNGIHVRLYSSNPGLFDESLDLQINDDYEDAARDAAKDGFDRFIINHKEINWRNRPFFDIPKSLTLIVLCHNVPAPETIKIISEYENVGRIICVSNEQKDLFLDHSSYNKIQCIFNSLPINCDSVERARNNPVNRREHIVTCISSLDKVKGFHRLAKIWPLVLREIPDAQLFVIGNGNLYNRGMQLGKFHLAAEDYENSFISYLTHDGELIDSVHFVGLQGVEKEEILLKTKLGVFPSYTETFCIGSVEVQLLGGMVVTMETPGSFDVVYNGLTARNDTELLRIIVKLLKCNGLRSYPDTLQYIKSNFSIEKVASEWEQLLYSDLQKKVKSSFFCMHMTYRFKWLKQCVRLSKLLCPLLRSDKFCTERLLRKMKYDGDHPLI